MKIGIKYKQVYEYTCNTKRLLHDEFVMNCYY